MIKANKINFSYGNLKVLKELDFEVKKGEFVSIIGASGSGKTTLLHLLGTLENTDGGEIIIDGRSVQKLSAKDFESLLEEFK